MCAAAWFVVIEPARGVDGGPGRDFLMRMSWRLYCRESYCAFWAGSPQFLPASSF
jgi:hypothetical protein